MPDWENKTRELRGVLSQAINNNLLVYDSDAPTQFTSRLYSLLQIVMARNYNDKISYIIKTKGAGLEPSIPEGVPIRDTDINLKKLAEKIRPDCCTTQGLDKFTVLAVGENGSVLLGSY